MTNGTDSTPESLRPESRKPETNGTPITDKARNVAHEAVDAASERAEDLERNVRRQASRVAHEVEEREEQVREQIDDTVASVETFIRERPVAAAGMAFAAGMLTALLLRR